MNPYYVLVARRADHRCEYCRAPESPTNSYFEVEHILPVARGGRNDLHNLALACRACNLRKRDQTENFDHVCGAVVPLFNPRVDRWGGHFRFDQDDGTIIGLTPTGRAIITLLDMNHPQQVVARSIWVQLRLYP